MNALLHEIDTLFEPSLTLRTILTKNETRLLLESRKGAATHELIDYIAGILRSMIGRPELDDILNAHPRLGAKAVDSAHSQAEQANLQKGSQAEAERLGELNARYEETFPGLRYVVFVNGRSRPTIMADMERRIERNDLALEREEGISAMSDIAHDRLKRG